MDIRKIIAVILAIALAVVLFILIRSDKGPAGVAKDNETPGALITDSPTEKPFGEPTDTPDVTPHYHVAVLSNSLLEHYPLVRIDLEGLEIPVYACTNFEGEVCFFVYAFEEVTGEYGFLPAHPSYPEVKVDNSMGFAELPRLAKGWTDGESGYPEIALASVNGEAAQFYYPSDGEGNMRDGAIPVVLEEHNHIFGAYFVFDEAHKALICPLDGTTVTPEPEETPEPSAVTSAMPDASAVATPKPTNKPNRTPKPSQTATPTASANPSATATTQPSVNPSATPTAAPSATPTAAPTATPTATPTAQPTAAPSATGSGHWELVWVVDQEEVKHQEWHCHVCGKVFLDKDSCMADQEYHKQNEGVTGWHVEWVIDSPEQGHWEPIWVPDP